MGLGAWDCQMCSFQSLCLCHCLCLCHRICHCHCHCICVTLPSLNSSCHELSENVWVWGCGTVRSADFDLWAKCRGWVGGWWWWVGGLDKRTSWSDLVGVRQKRFSGHGGYDGVDGSDDDGWVDSVLLQPIWGWWVPSGVCTPSQVILNVILLAIFHHFKIQVWPKFLWHSDNTNKCVIFHLTPVDNTVTESFLYQLLFIFWKLRE